ncbi:integrase core domain-containing protein [Schaalia sp. Marseille-Q2122]|uniref:integrase core domain-containing protein n=1 Tax=Schaalia sp. Marseille-Q2122 TaxID=2736604 RepID=UPI00158B57B7
MLPPGTPWNNGYLESFNNYRRRERLRRNDIANLIQARQTTNTSTHHWATSPQPSTLNTGKQPTHSNNTRH